MKREKYLLEAKDFYRYLQIRHFVIDKIKRVSESSKQLLDLFKRAYGSNKDRGIISGLYKGLTNMKTHSTIYIKAKWELEGGRGRRYNGRRMDDNMGIPMEM